MTAVPATIARDGALTLRRVIGLLAVIVALAFVLPYAAVYTLHVSRLRAADGMARDAADRLSDALRAAASEVPAGTRVLAGPGAYPRAVDERWSAVATLPLARVLGTSPPLSADPWGNAYLAVVASGGPRWVVSAGPDGILQTPLSSAGDRPSGDDRLAIIK